MSTGTSDPRSGGGDDDLPGLPPLPGLAHEEGAGMDEPIVALGAEDEEEEGGLDDAVGGLPGLDPAALTPIDERVEARDDGREGFDEPLAEDDLDFGSESASYADDGHDTDEGVFDDLDLGELGQEDGGELGFEEPAEDVDDEAPVGLPPLERADEEGEGPIGEPPPRLPDRVDD